MKRTDTHLHKAGRAVGVVIALAGFVAFFGEAPTAGLQIVWSLGSLAVMSLGHFIWNLCSGEGDVS